MGARNAARGFLGFIMGPCCGCLLLYSCAPGRPVDKNKKNNLKYWKI
jgi:hypothetical protein